MLMRVGVLIEVTGLTILIDGAEVILLDMGDLCTATAP